MEEAAEQLTLGDVCHGEVGSRVKRKMVQSTLFPKGVKQKEAEDEEGIRDEKEDDCCNSSKKKQRKSSKGKRNNNTKVIANGKEISNKKVDSIHSPVTMKSDFFMKTSQRRERKRQQKSPQKDQFCIVSHEENDIFHLSPDSAANIKSPQHLKQQPVFELEKKHTKSTSTPKKKVMNSGTRKSLFRGSLSESVLDKQRMENSCLSARRPKQLFFSPWKVKKSNEEKTGMDNTCCSVDTSLNPIHVFEADKDDASYLDWGDLMFSQGTFPNFNSGLGSGSFSEISVNSLQFDDFPTICCPSMTLTCQNNMSLDQCPNELNEENEIERFDCTNQGISSCPNSDADWKSNCFQQGKCNAPANSLWTDKYRPRKAAEICGNGESVKFISEWLSFWHEKASRMHRSSFEDEKTVENVDYSYSPSDADSENPDDETYLKNVLLVTGPVGSGKSAAIYACAEEQGFQIIEVNASYWRNGALVKQRFGEALESHLFQHKVDNTLFSEMKAPAKSVPGNTKLNKGSESEVVELIQLSNEEDSPQAYQNSCRSGGRQKMDKLKTLIFFEDVDATLGKDHGLLLAIKQLAETAKRPIILTANEYNPPLPHNLDRLEVQFRMPSLKELITHGHMICAAENVQIHASLIDCFVRYCTSDIRKTIMNLQFWCQSQNSQKGNGRKIAYSPFLFDLEAGHRLLPKLISWSCRSQLSELIEEEITKSSVMIEESNSLVDILVEVEMNERERQNSSRTSGTSSDCIGPKKEEVLSLNYSLQAEDEYLSQPQSNSQFSDISSSPIAFGRQNVRRRHGVISSDSEEDNFHEGTPVSGCWLIDASRIGGIPSNSPSHRTVIERCCIPNEQLSPFDGCNLEQRSFRCSETADFPCLNSVPNLADVSSVPESSAVPETEAFSDVGLFSATVTYSPHVCTKDADSMRNYPSPSLSPIECEKLSKPMHQDSGTLSSYSGSDKTTLCEEVVGDSHNVHGEGVPRVYQELDECSSCAVARTAKNFEKPGSHCQFNSVEETWQRLRNCRMDLKQHITTEQKDASHGLKLASGMTDLISEADLLLSYCQPHVYDFLESPESLHEKRHSYSWYDDQLKISSTFSEHAICFYAKEASVLGSSQTCFDHINLALEMLLCSTNTMSLGKLLNLDKKIIQSMDLRTPVNLGSLGSCKNNSSLCNVLQSVVPSRAYLALQGNGFHEYLSTLSQISRSETLQPSDCPSQRKQRRRRTAQHYLTSGTYSLSPEAISLLNQPNCYGKVCCQSGDSCAGLSSSFSLY